MGGGGVRFLLLALLVSLAALAGLTLSAAAQSADDGADDADPQGRIIARIQDRTGDDGVDDYRIEFGFFPQWAMEDKDPWAEAITTWSDWLPRARYLTKAVIDRRDADDNRRWLRSSLISVPASQPAQQDGSPDADFEGEGDDQQNLIEGRVVARYNPDSRGRLRVEFGFLPECAFETTSNTEEAVEQYGEDLLPRARYLSASMIESRRGVWLRSSVVEVPQMCEPPPPCSIEFTSPTIAVVRGEQNENRRIGSVRCDVTDELNPISVMGTPSGLTIRVVSTGPGPWNLTLSGTATADAGSYPVEITVRPAQGDPVPESVTIRVTTSPPPRINWEGYDPNEIAVLGDDPPSTENLTVVDAESDQPVSPRPRITYEVDEAAEEVCDVNRNDGQITPLAAGICIVIARSAETDQYAAGESDPVRVTITRVSPELRWDGYDEEELRPGGDPVRPREPQPRLSEARGELSYTYSATPSSICAVNSRTGELTPHREGECDVTVRSAATDKFRADEVTITVQIGPDRPPECARIPTVGPLDSGEARTINLDNYCRDPEGEDVRYSDARSDDPAVATARLVGSSLTVTAARTPAGDSALVTVTVADPARNEIEARVNVLVENVLPPEVRSVTCRPSRPEVNERVECTADIRGGEPESWNWRGGEASGPSNGETYRTVFRQAGDQPVDLTVRNAAGSDNGSTTVRVQEGRPQIIRINCSPSPSDVGESVTCTADLRGGEPDEWNWSGGESSGPNNGETYRTVFRQAGSQFVDLTVRNSAGSASGSTSVTVPEPPPEIDSISCSPSRPDVDENVTCTARLSGGTPDTYSWSGGDSSGSSATYRTSFSSSGDKTVRLTVRNSAGSDSYSTMLTIPVEEPDISVSCPVSAAVNANITCTVDNRGGAIDSYSWSDSDGGSGSSASYRTSFGSAGTKTVRLTARNSAGSDSDSARVNVFGPPEISISCPSSADVNENITCTVSNSGGAIDSYSWSDSDGGSGSSASYRTSFSTPGTKTVRLTARNSAGSGSDSARVIVTGAPVISVSCPSPAAVNANITCTVSNSGGAIDTYSWSDSDGGSGSSASYRTSFSTAGTKTVSLTARNSAGSDSDSDSVVVTPPPPVINSISCPSSATVDESITCTVSLGGGTPDTYSWTDNGGGSGSSTSYSTSFSTAGTYTVSLTVRNSGGSDDDTYQSVIVTAPPPEPDITINCPSSAAVNENITCTVSNSGGAIDTYSWSDSDGGSGSSTSYSRSFSSSGTKTVRLTARNSAGNDSGSARVDIIAPPVISVRCPSSAAVNRSITCTVNNSGGAIDTYSWTDSDGGSGSSTSYSRSFSTAGTKTVSLTARNSAGSDSDSDSVNVVGRPEPRISCSPSTIEEGDSTRCRVDRNSGGSISSYSWSANGGSPSSGSSSTYQPRFNTAGSYTVSLTASNSAGSSTPAATYSITVTVEPPDISISCTAYVMQGNSARCTVDNDGGVISSYAWSGGSSSGGSSSSYRPSFNSFGRQTVRLTASNAGGSDSDSIRVDVLASPAPTYGRCGSDGIRVYWFNSSGYDKRWLNMDWEDVAARVSGWGEHMIGHMSQSACDSWPNGPEVNTGNWPLP